MKTTLIGNLIDYLQHVELEVFFDGLPTNGVNLEEMTVVGVPKKRPKKIKVREVGGSLLLTWHRYYEDCRIVVVGFHLHNRLITLF